MDIIVAAPGRAGGAVALAAAAAGHRVIGLVARSPVGWGLSDRFQTLEYENPLPPADLLVLGARDQAIVEVAERLAPAAAEVGGAVHLSGFTPVSALAPLAGTGMATGSFHPLQSLPNPQLGMAALDGAWAAVTAAEPFRSLLFDFARSLRMIPFDLADLAKPTYHAAASASSNFVVAALAIAEGLFDSAGVPPAAARPLTEAAVANSYSVSPGRALTGPIARGDWDTVSGQLDAARRAGPELGGAFRAMAEATAIVAGTSLPSGGN
jgi:predicted short-subunit dehydrogenase-like oxidoreductase (DUF2520 family)